MNWATKTWQIAIIDLFQKISVFFQLKSKFGIKWWLGCSKAKISKRTYVFTSENEHFSSIPKEIESRKNFPGKPHQNMFKVLAYFLSHTSQTELVYYHQKLNVQIVSLVPERIKA